MTTPKTRKLSPIRSCENCEKQFQPRIDLVNRGMGKYCCRRCSWDAKQTVKTDDAILMEMYTVRDKTLKEIQNETGMNWKAVQRRLVAHDVAMRPPNRRFSEDTKYPTRGGRKIHRTNAEEMMGRELRGGNAAIREVVHHIDMDTTNNETDNLSVMTFNEHSQLHYQMQCLVAELYKQGVVGYNREENLYYLKPTSIRSRSGSAA